LNAADAAIADQLRTMSSGKFDKDIGNKKDRIVIDAFYSGRDYAPLWITDGKVNDQAKAAINYLRRCRRARSRRLRDAGFRLSRSCSNGRRRSKAVDGDDHVRASCFGRPSPLVAR
jgi:hypothetical protein